MNAVIDTNPAICICPSEATCNCPKCERCGHVEDGHTHDIGQPGYIVLYNQDVTGIHRAYGYQAGTFIPADKADPSPDGGIYVDWWKFNSRWIRKVD